MPIHFLEHPADGFPSPHDAMEDGLLAIGGDLSMNSLLKAYRIGIFPWYAPGDPILWWSPDPRFVVYPDDLKISHSMKPLLKQRAFRVTFDQDFLSVIEGCQGILREGQEGETWITNEMLKAYYDLHLAGWAHSVEVWDMDHQLVGGLYGLSMGPFFFGESMFSRVSNASKYGFIKLVHTLQQRGYILIDCQQETQHLKSLGGKGIPRKTFTDLLANHDLLPSEDASWAGWEV